MTCFTPLRILPFALVILAISGCGEGFKPNDKYQEKRSEELEEIVVYGNQKTLAAQQAKSAQVAAKTSGGLDFVVEGLSEKDADLILGVEMQAQDAKGMRLVALLNVGGQRQIFRGDVSVDGRLDMKPVKVNFSAQAAIAPEYGVQAIAYCEEKCQALFIHIQINKNGQKEAAAFYNFVKEENGSFKLWSSSVEKRYMSVSDALKNLK